jgi:hypothetical protein
MRTADGGDLGGVDAPDEAYRLVGTNRTFRVNPDNTFTPVIFVTASSRLYGVSYTWTLLASTWDEDGGPPLIALKTSQVNALCGHDHVQDFRTEQDQGPSQELLNFAVITVGTDDGAVTDEARVRMDAIGLPSAFAACDAVWARLVKAGASN